MRTVTRSDRSKAGRPCKWLSDLITLAVLGVCLVLGQGMWSSLSWTRSEPFVPRLGPRCLLSEDPLIGDRVVDANGHQLGVINDVVVDRRLGGLVYALVSTEGCIGSGDEVIPVPWTALTRNYERQAFILDVTREQLDLAPRFFKDKAPDLNDPVWDEDYSTYRW